MFVFVPIAGDAFQEYYSGLEIPWWVFPFQAGRGVLWGSLSLPAPGTPRGGRLEVRLTAALLFSVLMGSQLLMPNPSMPDRIRLAHLMEETPSNFLFGWAAAALLRPDGRRSHPLPVQVKYFPVKAGKVSPWTWRSTPPGGGSS